MAEAAWYERKLATLPLAWIEARVIEDEMGCWLWSGHMSNGALMAILTNGRGHQKTTDARRLVYRLVHHKTPDRSMSPRCPHNDCCVHPDHLRLRPASPVHASKALWCESIARARQRGSVIMSMEKAREIRSSAEPLRVVANRLGCSVSLASLVRRGLAWPEPRNPFSGLLLGVTR